MKAFIFDFDGVIVDSELYWDKYSLEMNQKIMPAFDEEYDKQLKGRNMHDVYEMLVRDLGLQYSKEEYITHMRTLTDRIYGELAAVLPGIESLVNLLQSKNIPTAIASSGERAWIEGALKRLHLENVFSPIVTAVDVGIGKPDPAVYLEAARILNVLPAECVALEDSQNGVRSAKAAGMYCIGLHHEAGYRQNLDEADRQIRKVEELTEDILKDL